MENLKGEVKLDINSYNELLRKIGMYEDAVKVNKSWNTEYLELRIDLDLFKDIIAKKIAMLEDGDSYPLKKDQTATAYIDRKKEPEQAQIGQIETDTEAEG